MAAGPPPAKACGATARRPGGGTNPATHSERAGVDSLWERGGGRSPAARSPAIVVVSRETKSARRDKKMASVAGSRGRSTQRRSSGNAPHFVSPPRPSCPPPPLGAPPRSLF
ncbi:hypothetical protein EYF80_026764 [Liparis tanakae]|uniref:Uncharacterized protein n=1 Tax=Liparis tanakae TaxID=230148 RepID=A0A4Z2HBA0_9TELE|nr:hypothetical protein EYF80_026764 [Liparis tanakae]